jgi:protein-tyrosine phosphatase
LETDTLPVSPLDEVIDGLWQADGEIAPAELFERGFDLVIDLSGRAVHGYLPIGALYVAHPIHDVERLDDPEAIRVLARLAAANVRAGRRVVVNCAAGLNRSGVVVARALVELGYAPDEAVALVRRARGEWALCNGFFERWVLEEIATDQGGTR